MEKNRKELIKETSKTIQLIIKIEPKAHEMRDTFNCLNTGSQLYQYYQRLKAKLEYQKSLLNQG